MPTQNTGIATTPKAELARIETDIKAWLPECRRGFVNYLGYRFLIGRALVQAKAIVPEAKTGPKGKNELVAKSATNSNVDNQEDNAEPAGFLAWKRAAFPGVPMRTLADHKAFADRAMEEHPELATVDLTTLPAEQCEVVFEKLRDCTSGKDVTLGVRAMGLIEDASAPGGFRPNKGELGDCLAKHHPELADKKWAELPAKIQRAFQEAVAAREANRYRKDSLTPAQLLEQRQWETEQVVSTVLPKLEKWAEEKTLLCLSPDKHPRGLDRTNLQRVLRTLVDQLERADGRKQSRG